MLRALDLSEGHLQEGKGMRRINNDDAVSPVIGDMLMITVTIILAAVISASVFSMVGSMSKTKVVALTAHRISDNSIVVTNHGGPDAVSLTSVNYNGDLTGGGPMGTGVGDTTTYTTGTPTNAHVIIVGKFTDGNSQILLDTYL